MACRARSLLLLAVCSSVADCKKTPAGRGTQEPPTAGDCAPSCVAGQHCDEASSTCACDNACAAGESRCGVGGSPEQCALAQGCPVWTVPVVCVAGVEVCSLVGAVAQCQCRPPPACTIDARSCSGDGLRLQTCGADAHGCAVPRVVHCPTVYGAGSTCVASPGQAHCLCPPSSASTVYVDGLHGDDQLGSGAGAPVECAFKTIAHGMAVASSGETVAVRPGTYSAAQGELFPIQLKGGVTLTTDVTPVDTTSYVIEGTGSVALGATPAFATVAALGVGVGAPVLRNFTLRAVQPVVPGTGAYAFGCSGGAPVLDHVVIDGADRGVAVLEGCAPTLTGLVARNVVSVGLRVQTTAGTTTVTAGTLAGAEVGLSLASGVISIDGLDISGAATVGVECRPSGGVLALAATGLRVHDGTGDGVTLRPLGGGGAYGAIDLVNAEVSFVQGVGITVQAGAPTLSGLAAHDNGNEGLFVDAPGGTVSLVAAVISANGLGNGSPGVTLVDGTLSATGASVVDANGDAGFVAVGGTLSIDGASIDRNRLDGVSHYGGATTLVSSTLSANLGAGVTLFGGTLGLTSCTVESNLMGGIDAEGGSLALAASLVRNNTGGPGLALVGDVTAVVTGSSVSGNGGAYGTYGNSGGILLALNDGATLSIFKRNLVFGNLYNGVDVYVAGVTLGDGAAGTCMNKNSFYCYGAGNVGVAAHSVTVDATHADWANAAPASTIDWIGPTVDAASPCGSVGCP